MREPGEPEAERGPTDADEQLRALVDAAGALYHAYHEHQALLPEAMQRLGAAVADGLLASGSAVAVSRVASESVEEVVEWFFTAALDGAKGDRLHLIQDRPGYVLPCLGVLTRDAVRAKVTEILTAPVAATSHYIRDETYGTLVDLATSMEEEDLASGYYVRVGKIGALARFIDKYQRAEPRRRTAQEGEGE